MKQLFPAALLLMLLAFSCTRKASDSLTRSPQAAQEPEQWDNMGKPAPVDEEMEDQYMLDPLVVTPDATTLPDTLAPYNPSSTFEHDLLHTKLELSFDWAKKRANGVATLTLKPWFYTTDKVTLDAKNFDVHSVTLQGQTAPLKYDYNNAQITIYLGKTYSRNDPFTVVINYTAKPDERESFGGSSAITSDKGLYFINPDGADKEKPRQIWTQGETESNSFWFPTVDKPNERCTQEMYLTVDNQYKTLSNGLLVSSKKNADGTRTDYWKMDKPHAPYLFMMAIGEFAVVKDKWRGIDVEYYVEPKFEAAARDIYPYTTDMLEFFSNKLGYAYPWSKFSQVVVRDYVSGAMENTTAVIFGEFMQKNKRELLDDHWTNEKVVAHEMFHHWFGDLLTTESWANLTLNEGFANYSEYLWLEHKYGRDEADYHEMEEQQGYFFSAEGGGHPLIHFGYNSREDMFDGHSYNKGGATLHMLRSYVGDDAFFTALQRYLKKHEYTDVEAHELRLAFEDVTGQDLNWFFNQWFFKAGTPNLTIDYQYDDAKRQMLVTLTQTQEPSNETPYIYDLPLAVDIYDVTGTVRREQLRMTKRTQTFAFPASARPAVVNVDAHKTLLCNKTDNHTPEEWRFLFYNAPLFMDRFEALQNMGAAGENAELTLATLKDKSRHIRQFGLSAVDAENATQMSEVARIAESDPDPECRAQAIGILGESGNAQYLPILKKGLGADQPYSVVSAALEGLSVMDPAAAAEASVALQNDDSEAVAMTLAKLYASSPNVQQVPFFEKQLAKVDQMAAFSVFNEYGKFVTGLNDPAATTRAIDNLKAISLSSTDSQWRRFAATKALADMRNHYTETGDTIMVENLTKVVNDIKEKETDPTLKLYYGMF
jgi:aminopeptidase N